jgi:hypothetical protein
MKKFKKFIIYFMLVPFLITSCSDDDDSSSVVIGCTDPQAVNYNPNADQQGVECLYTLVGDWTAYVYNIDETDALAVFSYIDLHFYNDNSYLLEAELSDGSLMLTTGVASLNDDTDTLNLFADNGGETETWNLTYLDGEYVFMNFTDIDGGFHDTEWVRY